MGVYLQNYSYLSCHYLQTSKLGTLLKPRQVCLILLFGKQIILFKKACMLMKPLEMKAKLAEK